MDTLFVHGSSGGGVLTSWVVGHTHPFAAASANCPVTNRLSFVGTTDGPYGECNFETFPWEDPAEQLERPPLMYVGNVTTPTNTDDARAGPADADLADRGVLPAAQDAPGAGAMLRFRNDWHGTSRTL